MPRNVPISNTNLEIKLGSLTSFVISNIGNSPLQNRPKVAKMAKTKFRQIGQNAKKHNSSKHRS